MPSRPSQSYRLRRKETPADGIRRIALGRAEAATERLRDVDENELAATIHGARKDLKKLRSVVRLVRGDLGGKLYRAEDRRYRDAGHRLSSSRDAEVKLEMLAALGERFEGDLPREPMHRWEEALLEDRDRLVGAQGETRRQIEIAVEAIEAGHLGISRWPLETESWKLVGPGLTEGYRRGRRSLKRTLKRPSAKDVHEWRKRVKDLWYQLRIVGEAWPEPIGEMADQAHQLADLLGDHHDLAVLAEDLAERREVGGRKAFRAAIERQQEELLDSALRIGRRLYAEKPEAFERRFEAYWSVWRDA
jgi:CHAD domain-containing protein